jgi:DNA repair photolyase
MIREINIVNPITSEGQPDGGSVPIIDPYDGCQLYCPYCFQICDSDWNKDIYVKTNIAEILDSELEEWSKSTTIYMGSRCDPYMQIEEKYHLTRKCLEKLSKWNIPTMITTKSDNGLIFRDMNLLREFKSQLTVLMGMSNINQINKGADNQNIKTANELHKVGIQVWAFITPILPYIMDVDAIINSLNPNIPIFLDKLRIFKDSVQSKVIADFIKKQYPNLIEQYIDIINNGDENYYCVLEKEYKNNSKIKVLFNATN